MALMIDDSDQLLKSRIKHIWWNLSDEEIACYDGLRDVFFMAVRKKHGLPRAQAEELLRNLPYCHENAA